MMKIAIIGTRGIPNHYGGFEQCAEYLALGLVQRGFEVLVYNSHNHPYQESSWQNVEIVHCYDPEYKLGTIGQFIYDLNCIWDIRKRKVDVILQLGYTSSSVWGWLLPKNVIVTTNMDGLEWKRAKYSKPVRQFLTYAEKLGVKYSDYLIADSVGIQEYLKDKYGSASVYIPYGANVFENPDASALKDYNVEPCQYNMLIARLEPENSIEIILDGVNESGSELPFLVIGKHTTKYGEYIKNKYAENRKIIFVGGVYNIDVLNNLRHFSNLYFHGHTVGGTNPSLLEAMASDALICAHDNVFNGSIVEGDGFYFKDKADVADLIKSKQKGEYQILLENNRRKIVETYNWERITSQYADHLTEISHGTIKRS